MMCCFGGISRAPLAVMLMVAEMTGSLSILAPAMIAVGLAWFIVRRSDDTIYRSQLKSRADAPAQRLLLGMPVLANVSVRQAMAPPRLVITGGTSRRRLVGRSKHAGVTGAPVVDDEGRFEGTVALSDLSDERGTATRTTRGRWSTCRLPLSPNLEHLDVAVDAMATASEHWVPVLDNRTQGGRHDRHF